MQWPHPCLPVWANARREAWSRAGLPQDGDATFLDCAAQLLAAARLQHVRVAPDVCECALASDARPHRTHT